MLIHFDPDEHESYSTHCTCPFHKEQPGVAFAGCTCSFSIGQRRRAHEDLARIKAERQRQREEAIIAEATAILERRTDDHKRSFDELLKRAAGV